MYRDDFPPTELTAPNRRSYTRLLSGALLGLLGAAALQGCSAAQGAHGEDEYVDAFSEEESFAGVDDPSSAETELDADRDRDDELAGEFAEEPRLGQLEQALGGTCGSQSSAMQRFLDRVVVPDHFPPDSVVASLIAGPPTDECRAFGRAHLHEACDGHDACYGRAGASKRDCDLRFRSQLRSICADQYEVELEDAPLGIFSGGASVARKMLCEQQCKEFSDVMFAAVGAFGGGAFDAAQDGSDEGSGSAAPRTPAPACVAQCQSNCLSLPADQIGQCQVGCPDACRP